MKKYLQDRFTVKDARLVGNSEFLEWFEELYGCMSRPMLSSVLYQMEFNCIGDKMAHDMLKYIEFTGKYTVYYNVDGLRTTPWKRYGYISGKFDRYWIFDKEGQLVKTAVPKGNSETETESKTEDIDNPDDIIEDPLADKIEKVCENVRYSYGTTNLDIINNKYIQVKNDTLIIDLKSTVNIDVHIKHVEEALELLRYAKELYQ